MAKNYARKIGIVQNILGMIQMLFFAVLFIAGGILLQLKGPEGIDVISYFLYGFAALMLLFSWMSIVTHKRLSSAEKNPPSKQELHTSTVQEHKIPLPEASLAQNEKIEAGYGPLNRQGFSGSSTIVMGKETMRGGENTVFVTKNQLIFVILGTKDLDAADGDSVRNKAVAIAPTDAISKSMWMNLSGKKNWPAMIESAKKQPLSKFLQTHVNYGLPFNQVASVQKGFLSGTLKVKTKSGQKLSWFFYNKAELEALIALVQSRIS